MHAADKDMPHHYFLVQSSGLIPQYLDTPDVHSTTLLAPKEIFQRCYAVKVKDIVALGNFGNLLVVAIMGLSQEQCSGVIT